MVRARGEIDLATADLLDLAIDSALSEGVSSLSIDLSEVTFIDSTGVRSLMVCQQKVADAGLEMTVVVPPGPVARTLSVTGVDSLLTLVDPGTEGDD